MCTRTQRDSSTAIAREAARRAPRARRGSRAAPATRRGRSARRSRAPTCCSGRRRTSKRSGSGNSRSSRFAEPVSSRMRAPFGTRRAVPLDVGAWSRGPGTATARCSGAPPRRRRECSAGSATILAYSSGMAREEHARVRQQLRHRLVAGGAEQRAEADDLAVGEARRPPSSPSISASSSADTSPSFGVCRSVSHEPDPVVGIMLRHRDARPLGNDGRAVVALERHGPSTRGAGGDRPRARRAG